MSSSTRPRIRRGRRPTNWHTFSTKSFPTRAHSRVTLAAGGGPGCPVRGGAKVKVWQAGSHLRTSASPRRRLVVATDPPAHPRARPARPSVQEPNRARDRHPRRLHARRAPPAVPREGCRRRRDRAGRPRCPHRRRPSSSRRHRRLRAVGCSDLLHGVGRRARCRSPHPALRPPAATLARTRAEPHGSDHQPHHERRRGTRPAGHGRHLEPRPELAPPGNGGRPLHSRLAACARDPRRPSVHGRGGVVSLTLEPRTDACASGSGS